MRLSYKEFEEVDARWLDDIALVSRIVKQYEDSRECLKVSGATLGNSMGSPVK